MMQIKITDITPFMKKGWVAMDRNKQWWFFEIKPKLKRNVWLSDSEEDYLNGVFDIAPADDWTKSLLKVGGK